MKKSVRFVVDGVELKIPYILLLVFVFIMAAGAVTACLLNGNGFFGSEVFSPVSFSASDGGFLNILVKNFITYSTFVILGLLAGSSAFGFVIAPALTFLAGFSVTYTACYMMAGGSYLRCFLLCLPLWAVFAAILLLYDSLCFSSSFALFKSSSGDVNGDFSLQKSIKLFYFTACLSTAVSIVTSLLQFVFFRILP